MATRPSILALLVGVAALAQTLGPGAVDTGVQGGAIGRGAPDQNAPPIIDIALRMIRAAEGGSSLARSAVRQDAPAFLFARLDSCVMGASLEDPARERSITWRSSGRVHSVERGIAVADVEWQRLEYRASEFVAGPRVRMTLRLPLGERVAVDLVEVRDSACRVDALTFEVGVAHDDGRRLAMSSEGRSARTPGEIRGAIGRRLTPADVQAQEERRRLGDEAWRSAAGVTRPMPPRQYTVDVWLVPEVPGSPSPPALSQRLTQVLGGTGGRFAFRPMPIDAGNRAAVVEIAALVIPVGGERLAVAITRHVTPTDGAAPVSAGWMRAMTMPSATDVLSFQIPAPLPSEPAIGPRQKYGLRLRIGHQ